MVLSGFDFFITVDKNLRYQQNLHKFSISIFILLANDNKIETLQKLIVQVKNKITNKEFTKLNEII